MKDSNVILSTDDHRESKNEKKTMTNNEELLGGCCVCSDDQGFSNNALVYCDGKGCTVACHTACYGIVSIPDGDWYCRRCEAGQLQASCRLCPMIEGAMKRTADGGWAHVVCALYIPEVSFGNDQTMEPIILEKIPSIRYEQSCSICLKRGRSIDDASKGACCECTMKNCTQVFHITCAQQEGLLYEDVRKNNCQYPIYCEQHRPKFSKFIRQIPAFHYKSSERKHSSKEKANLSQLSDFVCTSIAQTKKPSDETSQTASEVSSLDNLSRFVELNKEERTSLPSTIQNQTTSDTRELSTNTGQQSSTSICTNTASNDNNHLPLKKNSTAKIKTEENDKDYQIIDKKKLTAKDIQARKKRPHSTEGGPRPVGRPPSKKTLQSQEKPKSNESHPTPIEFYPRRPLQHRPTTPLPPRSLPAQTLEEFLEQEWESSSDFLLQQTMPHDVSSLLSCLYQFKSENASLQKKFDELKHRRDSLRVTNANLRRKLAEVLPVTPSPSLPRSAQPTSQKSQSPTHENPTKSMKLTPSEINAFPASLPYEPVNPYAIIKNERTPPTNGLSLELLSQILATNGSQLFAPTWNISNFGYANFPGANSISVSDESVIRSYSSFEQ